MKRRRRRRGGGGAPAGSKRKTRTPHSDVGNKANQASGRIEPHITSTPTKHDNTFVSETVWSSDRARNTNLATACNCQHTTEKKEAHLDLHEFAYPMFPLQLLKGKHVPTVKGQLLNMFFRLRPDCGPFCATWSLKHLTSGPQETKISTWVDILCTALGKRHQKGNLDLFWGSYFFSTASKQENVCHLDNFGFSLDRAPFCVSVESHVSQDPKKLT